jgi:hypothetical protein
MYRLGLAMAAIGAAALAWAAPEASRHEKFGLEITFPQKWIVGSGDEPLLLLSRSTDPVSLANCVATGEQIADTRALTQQQLNQGLAAPFGEDFWRQVYATSGLVAEVKAQSAREHGSGVTIQEAFFDLSKQGAPAANKMSVHQAIFVRPGYTVTVACSARAAAYPKQKAVLAGVIDSVRFFPPSPAVASGEPAAMPVGAQAFGPDNARLASGSASRAGQALFDLSK